MRARRLISLSFPRKREPSVLRLLLVWNNDRSCRSSSPRALRCDRRLLREHAVLHHHQDPLRIAEDRQVRERIAVDEQQVGEETVLYLAELVALHHVLAAV